LHGGQFHAGVGEGQGCFGAREFARDLAGVDAGEDLACGDVVADFDGTFADQTAGLGEDPGGACRLDVAGGRGGSGRRRACAAWDVEDGPSGLPAHLRR